MSAGRIVLIVVLSFIGLNLLIALMSAALFLNAGGSIKSIWNESKPRDGEHRLGLPLELRSLDLPRTGGAA